MNIDGDAVRSLHVLKGDAGTFAGSLYAFLNQTFTAPGRRRLRQWLLHPLRDERVIEARLDVVEEFSGNYYVLQLFREAVKRLKHDYERKFVKSCRLCIKTSKVYNIVRFNQTMKHDVDAMELHELAPKGASTLERVLMDAVDMVSFWEMHKRELLNFTQLLDVLMDICEITSIIKPLAERNVSISHLMNEVEAVQGFIRELRASLVVTAVEKKKFVVTPSPMVFVEFGNAAREAIRERNQDPILRRQNERQRKEIRNLYIPLSDDERDDECDAEDRADLAAANAFTEVMSVFREEISRLERIVSAMCDLDVLQGFATVCASSRGAVGFCRPKFSSKPNELEITKSWYPLLKPSIVDTEKGITHENGIVDNDISLQKSFILLTGPNMSGKSSLLRQIATTVIMAQIGCYVPAADFSAGIVDQIMTRIGGDDSLANGVSTFLNEMQGTSKILSKLTASSLIVLDELGRGTSTLDGFALAYATALSLASPKGVQSRVLFATHYHDISDELTQTEARDAFVTRHIGVKSVGSDLRFTYKIEDGCAPLGSCALNVARLAGFPPGILTRASHVAKTVNLNRERVADGLISTYAPPADMLSSKEHTAFSRLITDAAIIGDSESLGDGRAWARRFYALWCECRVLTATNIE
jgi:DNA mismatch repair ATPase MutS